VDAEDGRKSSKWFCYQLVAAANTTECAAAAAAAATDSPTPQSPPTCCTRAMFITDLRKHLCGAVTLYTTPLYRDHR